MNDIKPNEPFNADEEQDAYNEYKKSESYVKYNGEDIPVDYKVVHKDEVPSENINLEIPF
jgi:hypothetical protein